ncbi:uncharacterized mitochondrial protein-like protein [Tanacetum coccineum]
MAAHRLNAWLLAVDAFIMISVAYPELWMRLGLLMRHCVCGCCGLSRIHKAKVLRLIWFPTLAGRLITVAAKVGVPSLFNAIYKAIGCLCLRLLSVDAFIMISVAYPELWMRLGLLMRHCVCGCCGTCLFSCLAIKATMIVFYIYQYCGRAITLKLWLQPCVVTDVCDFDGCSCAVAGMVRGGAQLPSQPAWLNLVGVEGANKESLGCNSRLLAMIIAGVDPQLEWVEAEAFIKLKDDNNDTQLGINNNVDHHYQQQQSAKCKSILRLGEELTEITHQYLRGTQFQTLLFPSTSALDLCAYCDSDWVGDVVHASQLLVEYQAMTLTTSEIVWLRWLLADMGVRISCSTPLQCDNHSVFQIACNSVFHERTKHIEIYCHFTRHHLQVGTISLPFVPSIYYKVKEMTCRIGQCFEIVAVMEGLESNFTTLKIYRKFIL